MSAPAAPARSLRRAEAEARAALLDVTAYDVHLDLRGADEGARIFASTTTIALTSRGGRTFLDLRPVELGAVRLDGVALDTGLLRSGRFPLDLPAGEHRVEVEAVMAYRHDGEGLHLHTDPADGLRYVYAMCFMDAAPTVFACFDQPDLKAPYAVRVDAPAGWVVAGNAPARQVDDGGWELGPTPPLATYFVTVVAGPWHVVRDEHDGIPLALSARASLARHLDDQAEELLTLTGQCLDELHRLFGIRYPFGDYHQAFVPDFNAGAMENPGCVTFRDAMVFTSRPSRGQRITRASTIAHEMAHQWFGDLLTPRWWDDLWLNESFAEYLGTRVTAEATAYDDAWVASAYARRQWGLVADLGPTTHPVAGNGADDALAALQDFDGISYAKGSAILRQVAADLGDEVFFGGAAALMRERRFGNATMADLLASWERVGGRDLGALTREWLTTSGADRVELDRAAGVVLRTPPTPPPGRAPAERTHVVHVAVEREGRLELEPLTLGGPRTPYDAGPGDRAVVPDPLLESWTATVLDPETVDALPRLLPGVDDPAVRAGTWSALRTTLHHAAVSPEQVLRVVEAGPPVEDTDDARRHTAPWVLSHVVGLGPSDARARVHAAARRVLGEQAPGSETQLAALRLAVATAGDPGDLDRLGRWLGGDDLPPGVELDDDLRWRVATSLAGRGRLDRAALDDLLARAPSAAAATAHTRAVAALPDADAKAWAWLRFTGEVEVSGHEVEAAGAGFWAGDQVALTAPWVPRWFEELPAMTARRSGWVQAETVEHFFPRTALDEATLGRTRAAAGDDALPVAVRRRLAVEADGLARRLAVLARWPR